MLQRRRSFLLSSALAAGACGRGKPTQRIRLVLAGTPANLAYLPHTIAQQLNFYRKEGLLVALDAVPGGTRAAQALLGGSTDVVVGFFDHSIRTSAQGQRVQPFVTMTRYPGNVLITSPYNSERIRKIEDLARTSVGVSDLGSQPHMFLSYLLVRHGMSPSDVIPVGTGPQKAAIAALERGRLDAWSGMEPGVTMVLRRHANVRVLADARTHQGVREIFGVDAYPGSVLYAKRDWLRQNSDNARRLAKAIQASLQWIHRHSVDDIMSVVPADHLGQDRSVYREAVLQSRDIFSQDGKMPEEGPHTVRKVLAASLDSVRKAHLDLDSTYTNEFVTGK